MIKNRIRFTCWEKDPTLEIQLEPEAVIFKVPPGNEICFVGISNTDEFKWALRIEHISRGIQLFPDSPGPFSIEIFENGVLLDDWYKYM